MLCGVDSFTSCSSIIRPLENASFASCWRTWNFIFADTSITTKCSIKAVIVRIKYFNWIVLTECMVVRYVRCKCGSLGNQLHECQWKTLEVRRLCKNIRLQHIFSERNYIIKKKYKHYKCKYLKYLHITWCFLGVAFRAWITGKADWIYNDIVVVLRVARVITNCAWCYTSAYKCWIKLICLPILSS